MNNADSRFSLDLRDALIEAAEEATGIKTFYISAPKEEQYPYIIVNHRRLSNTDGIGSYSVEFDLWDRFDTVSRISVIADRLDEALDRLIINKDTFHARLFKGSRLPIDDQDKQIKRLQDVFQMNLVERK